MKLQLEKKNDMGLLKDGFGVVRGLWFRDIERARDPQQLVAAASMLKAYRRGLLREVPICVPAVVDVLVKRGILRESVGGVELTNSFPGPVWLKFWEAPGTH